MSVKWNDTQNSEKKSKKCERSDPAEQLPAQALIKHHELNVMTIFKMFFKADDEDDPRLLL